MYVSWGQTEILTEIAFHCRYQLLHKITGLSWEMFPPFPLLHVYFSLWGEVKWFFENNSIFFTWFMLFSCQRNLTLLSHVKPLTIVKSLFCGAAVSLASGCTLAKRYIVIRLQLDLRISSIYLSLESCHQWDEQDKEKGVWLKALYVAYIM